MGYAVQVQQGTHDLGVDVIAHPDPLVCNTAVKDSGEERDQQDRREGSELRGLLNQGEKACWSRWAIFRTTLSMCSKTMDLVLIDGERFVELFLEFYDRLDPAVRNQFSLRRVHVLGA